MNVRWSLVIPSKYRQKYRRVSGGILQKHGMNVKSGNNDDLHAQCRKPNKTDNT